MHRHIAAISDDRYGCPGVFAIMRCSACGQMATWPPLRESDLPALYSTYYPRRTVDHAALAAEAARVVAPAARWRRWLHGTDNQGHYGARPGERVLDIGSGSCLALLELQAMGVHGRGIEADPNVADIARHFGLKVHIGSIHDRPFADESFDLIVLNQVIEHVPDPLALLVALKDRLADGGRVVLSFPNTASRQAARSGARWINWHVPYHQHHFNAGSFARLARRAGYDVASCRSITPNLWTLLQRQAERQAPVEGQPSATWVGAGNMAGPASFAARVRNALQAYLARLAVAPAALTNRFWDALGRGDSLLVELRVAHRARE